MPEAPEVESLRRYLVAQGVVGRTIIAVHADWPGIENTNDAMGGLKPLTGRKITGTSRHGKNLFLLLDRGVLWLHMGMTGRLVIMPPDAEPLKYARITFYLDDERRIELDDPRRWASAQIIDGVSDVTGALGPDALDPSFTAAQFTDAARKRRAPIKSLLMDQHVLAGVGNIYADEALHRARISPLRPANRISVERLTKLFEAIRVSLDLAVGHIVANPNEDGSPFIVDAYDDRMRLPRKKGVPCPDCGTALSSHKFGGRTAYYCRSCQK